MLFRYESRRPQPNDLGEFFNTFVPIIWVVMLVQIHDILLK